MTHIVSYCVAGLAGRREEVAQDLDRHLNIFFGLNGSGKTSLLRILHSALSGNPWPLQRAAFDSAEVHVYSVTYDQVFSHRIDKNSIVAQPSEEGFSVIDEDTVNWIPGQLALFDRGSTGRMTPWEITPSLPKSASGRWAHKYLPTWRLYSGARGVGAARAAREMDWDAYFAETLGRLWSDYAGELLARVRKIQAEGLAKVLGGLLVDRPAGEQLELTSERAEDIYKRVSAFLERQGAGGLGSYEEFLQVCSEDPRLQRVVGYIDSVERRIQNTLRPQTELEALIEKMFTGRKRVLLQDTRIRVETDESEEIGLASLSSGEKQVLRILIENMQAEENCILIDEPEISLHIDWQHDLVNAMRSLNKESQLIMATHSPEIMAEVEDEYIHRL